MAAANPGQLIEQLKLLVENPESFSHDAAQRGEIERLGVLATRSLETPEATTRRLIFSPLPVVVARISQDFNIYSTLAKYSEEKPASLDDLLKASGLDKSILTALLDYNGGHGNLKEVKPGLYAPTKLTHVLLAPPVNDAVLTFHDCVLPTFAALHGTLKNSGKPNSLTAFQAGHNTSEKDLYAWLEDYPVQQGAFYRFMKTANAGWPTWLDVVKFDTEIASGAQPNEPVFVDVGGGFGWQCRALRSKYPQLPGRIILQDRADVIAKAKANPEVVPFSEVNIDTQDYDFFNPQPIVGARSYFLGMILHNWDDADCVRILRNLAAAMNENSVLLIQDYVLGERATGAHYAAAFSIAMRTMHNAQERSKDDFLKLLKEVGLVLDDVRVFTPFGISIIFARKSKA